MDEHIDAMARRLVEAGLVRPDQREAAEAVMGGHWADKVAVVWEVADVLHQCPGLTAEEAMQILLSEAVGGDADCEATAECIRDTAAEWYGDRAFAEGGGEESDMP